jgi:transcriptional regulator with XRE-family HTH domain
MTFDRPAVPLRTLRIRSGLSQREIGEILGFFSDVPVSRHETGATLCDLRTALGYQVIFRTPISAQFSKLLSMIEPLIEGRLAELEKKLERQEGRLPIGLRGDWNSWLCGGTSIFMRNETSNL